MTWREVEQAVRDLEIQRPGSAVTQVWCEDDDAPAVYYGAVSNGIVHRGEPRCVLSSGEIVTI